MIQPIFCSTSRTVWHVPRLKTQDGRGSANVGLIAGKLVTCVPPTHCQLLRQPSRPLINYKSGFSTLHVYACGSAVRNRLVHGVRQEVPHAVPLKTGRRGSIIETFQSKLPPNPVWPREFTRDRGVALVRRRRTSCVASVGVVLLLRAKMRETN